MFENDALAAGLETATEFCYDLSIDQFNFFGYEGSDDAGDVQLAGGFKPTVYEKYFVKAYPAFEQFLGKGLMNIHHRIPQMYRGIMGDEAIDVLSNLVALPKKFHNEIVSTAWSNFRRLVPNPTQKQIIQFANAMDGLLTPYANDINKIKNKATILKPLQKK